MSTWKCFYLRYITIYSLQNDLHITKNTTKQFTLYNTNKRVTSTPPLYTTKKCSPHTSKQFSPHTSNSVSHTPPYIIKQYIPYTFKQCAPYITKHFMLKHNQTMYLSKSHITETVEPTKYQTLKSVCQPILELTTKERNPHNII